MIELHWFRGRDIEGVAKMVDKWLEKNRNIEIITVGQSEHCWESSVRITITIFYKEKDYRMSQEKKIFKEVE